jgi:phage terminase large subunit-like protein
VPDPVEYFFDDAEADRACDFFSGYVTHVKGELRGQPFRLEEWERHFVRNLFGWRRPGGTRRYRRACLGIPRKNGKTTLGSGIALYLTIADREPGAEVYSAAGDRDQAALMFDAAKSMVQASPELSERCEIYKRSIVVPKTGASYKVLSSDAGLKHGTSPHAVLFDELHVQKNRDLWEALSTGQGARRQPLFIWISTAGFDTESLCHEQWVYAQKVRDGIINDPEFLPVLYEASKDDDWRSPATWKKANPNYGVSIKPEFLEAECKKAGEVPAEENSFKRLYLNLWTEQRDRWLAIDKWDACDLRPVDLDALKGRECFVGLDLSSTQDVTAAVYVFPDKDGGADVFARFWIPEESMHERERRDRVPYGVWRDAGLVEATPGNAVDYDFIEARIAEDAERFKIKEIAYDPWNAQQLAANLTKRGLEMVEFRQGFLSMSAPTKDLLRRVLAKKLNHAGNPVLRWMASNAVAVTDPAGNIKLSKPKPSSPHKIDGLIALVMALGRAPLFTPKKSASIYETRRILGF